MRYIAKAATGFGVERGDMTEGPRDVHAAIHHQRHGFDCPAASAIAFVLKPERPGGRQPGNVLHIDLLQRGVSLRLMIVTNVRPVALRLQAQKKNKGSDEGEDAYRPY